MLFSSISFLYYFLPVVLILYFLAPGFLKNTVLLLSSLVFYGWGEPKYVFLMIASIIVGYISGLLIEAFHSGSTRSHASIVKRMHRSKDESCRIAAFGRSKAVLIVSVVILLGFLAYFKYADFFIDNFNTVTGLSVPLLRLALPIGISFYTFQILSYVVDVYRKKVPAQKNLIHLAAYVSMFPQLIAGPIVRYADINKELEQRSHSMEGAALGARRFVIGLSKKILIANILGELCDIFKLSEEKSVFFFWLYGVAFALHIYFDFSGYSDMAIGLGRIFGFHFPENFDHPYISGSVTEFWRRWHMSLGSWFRDYLYIPLGGNRVPKWRFYLNILVVWMATGFWHGAAWNFVIWGLFFAVLLVMEKMWLLKYLEKSKVMAHIYVLFAVMISFVIFGAADMGEALQYIGCMFGTGDIPLVSAEFFYYLKSYGMVLALGIIGSTPLVKNLAAKALQSSRGEKVVNVLEPIALVVLQAVVTAYLVDGSFNPFLYFRF